MIKVEVRKPDGSSGLPVLLIHSPVLSPKYLYVLSYLEEELDLPNQVSFLRKPSRKVDKKTKRRHDFHLEVLRMYNQQKGKGNIRLVSLFALIGKGNCNLGKIICQIAFSVPDLYPHVDIHF